MRLPKAFGFPVLTVGFMLASSTAMAQTMMFSDVDTNGDGYLSPQELTAAFGNAGLGLLAKDQDGDGIISRDEMRRGSSGDSDEDDSDQEEGESGGSGGGGSHNDDDEDGDDPDPGEDGSFDDDDDRDEDEDDPDPEDGEGGGSGSPQDDDDGDEDEAPPGDN